MNFFIKIGNFFNKAILYSPLHGLASSNTLLISFRGRRSGKAYSTPVNYAQADNIVRITSSTDRKWWRNLKDNPEVELQLRGKAATGTAEVFEEPKVVADELAGYLKTFPQAAHYFGIGLLKDGSFNPDDLLQSSKGRVMVKVTING
jgi:deazaflavin-dependent oxidoreductase (nitroreductase family)